MGRRERWLGHWILDKDNNIIPENDVILWAHWFEEASRNKKRIVKQEWIGDSFVSTVFLGIDHNFSEEGPPVLWETMVFTNRSIHNEMMRCAGTWEQAEAMHEQMVLKVCEVEGISLDKARKKHNG